MGQENGPGLGYKKLIAWRKAHELVVTVYSATRNVPREDHWFRQQICRAAFSVPSNIVEGYTRRSRKEYLHFLNIARASLAEVEYQLLFMEEVGLTDAETYNGIDRLRSETAAVLYGLIRSLEAPPAPNNQLLREPEAEYLTGGEFYVDDDEGNKPASWPIRPAE